MLHSQRGGHFTRNWIFTATGIAAVAVLVALCWFYPRLATPALIFSGAILAATNAIFDEKLSKLRRAFTILSFILPIIGGTVGIYQAKKSEAESHRFQEDVRKANASISDKTTQVTQLANQIVQLATLNTQLSQLNATISRSIALPLLGAVTADIEINVPSRQPSVSSYADSLHAQAFGDRGQRFGSFWVSQLDPRNKLQAGLAKFLSSVMVNLYFCQKSTCDVGRDGLAINGGHGVQFEAPLSLGSVIGQVRDGQIVNLEAAPPSSSHARVTYDVAKDTFDVELYSHPDSLQFFQFVKGWPGSEQLTGKFVFVDVMSAWDGNFDVTHLGLRRAGGRQLEVKKFQLIQRHGHRFYFGRLGSAW